MQIEEFFSKSQGVWTSMRSSHSLAFKQFEQVVSTIQVSQKNQQDTLVLNLLEAFPKYKCKSLSAYLMEWEAESDWDPHEDSTSLSGSSILIPIPQNEARGIILRSVGYAEAIKVETNYHFSSNGTLILKSKYEQSISEEQIWFVTENLRCRSSVLKTSTGSGVLQTSFASEVRKLNI